jgi:hypothetical protein
MEKAGGGGGLFSVVVSICTPGNALCGPIVWAQVVHGLIE